MAVSIETEFDALLFTAQLPDIVNVGTTNSEASVLMELYVDSQKVFETDVVGNSYLAVLYDIRSIIEEEIKKKVYPIVTCKIKATEGNDYDESDPFTVILSDIDIPSQATWLATHFLTTRKSFTISRSGKQTLSWYTTATEATTYVITGLVRTSAGVQTVVDWQQNISQTLAAGIHSETINIADIISHFASNGTLLQFTINRGANRSITFYLTDDTPDLTFKFKNNFGVEEFAEISATSKYKQKLNASEAEVLRKITLYDRVKETEYEVESGMLSYEEAMWLAQFLSSSKAHKVMANGTYKEVIIDGESDVTDKVNDINSIKFKYKYREQIEFL